MDDGGINLETFIKEKDKYKSFSDFLHKYFGFFILYCINFLILMNKYKLIHRDIKLVNILINVNPNLLNEQNPYKTIATIFKFIDFDTLVKQPFFISLLYRYEREPKINLPIEYMIVANLFSEYDEQYLANNCATTIIKTLNETKLYKTLSLDQLTHIIKTIYIQIIKQLKDTNKPIDFFYNTLFANKFDIYSLGLVLLKIFDNVFLESDLDNIHKFYYSICVHMSQLNPTERCSIEQLHDYCIQLKNILNIPQPEHLIQSGGSKYNKYLYTKYKYLYTKYRLNKYI